MTNEEMIDYAKNEMVQIMKTYVGQVSVEAGKALAFLIMSENKQIIPTLTPKYNSTTDGMNRYECPECGKEITGCNYCPNCGAKFI